jgi:hypothetical protein
MDEDKIQQDYDKSSPEERKKLYELFKKYSPTSELDNDDAILETYKQMKRVIYKDGIAPPTPRQFLDPAYGWLPKRYVDDLRDWVKTDFIEFFENQDKYNQTVQYGATRLGKTVLALLCMLYTIVYCHHLRDMQAYYGVAQSTSLCMYILSFKYDKVYEIYLKKIFQLMEKNDRFVEVKRQDLVKKRQAELGQDYIVYSKASTVGEITLASELQIICGNDDALSVIGSDILQAYVSEIAFFIEKAGATEEEIFRLYSDTVQRIFNTVGYANLAFTYLDTSANNSESKIENYILKTLRYEKDVMFRQRSQWEVKELLTKNFPIWSQTGETFKICSGDGRYPAKIIEDPSELNEYPKELIREIPIDSLRAFKRNLAKSIKDIAGIPTSGENKFISNTSLIDRVFDNPSLKNIEHGIICDVKETNTHIIWDSIVDKFFVKYDQTNYVLKRCPKEARYIGLDLAFSAFGDVASIALMHKEYSRQKKTTVYVYDFVLAILPGENGINLGSITQFVIDLKEKGKVFINGGAIDSFQSQTIIQTIEAKGINIKKHSNSMDNETHYNILNELMSGTIKVGKNIFLKNNMQSLYRSKDKNKKVERIVHTEGKSEITYNGDWEKSECGLHHDDCYVAMYQAYWSGHAVDDLPGEVYEDQNRKFGYVELEQEVLKILESKSGFTNSIKNTRTNEVMTPKEYLINQDARSAYKNSLPMRIGNKKGFGNLINRPY